MIVLNPSLFYLPASERRLYKRKNLTYGSLTMNGLNTLVNTINHINKHERDLSGVCFDLGCGDGELIYHLQNSLPGSIWHGVEISAYRVSLKNRDVSIWQGDMLKEDLKPYSILHAANVCWDTNLINSLNKKIALEFSGLFISYMEIVTPELLEVSRKITTVMTETSWTKNYPIHFYIVN